MTHATTLDPGLAESLPPQYARWLQQCLGRLPLRESKATCDRCPLRAHEEGVCGHHRFGVSKCCTYLPSLPNFLVGAILTHPATSAATRQSVVDRIERGVAVTPLGIGRSPLYALTYDAVNEGVFGRADGLQCPHFEASTGSCGIWLHRNAVCSTWFCRHNRGIAGQEMWSDINRLLRIVERSLSIWAAERLGLASSGLRQALLMAEAGNAQVLMLELGGDWPAVGRRCWAGWHRPVADFFVEADKLVAPLEWTQVRHICGSDLSAHVAVCRDSVTTLDSEVPLPPVVRTAPQLGIQYGRTLTTRNALDGLRLSVPMIQALEVASNGCPIADVLACGVTEREIRELLDWRALVEGG